MRRLEFFSTCVGWPLPMEEYRAMIDSAKSISRNTFLKHVNQEQMLSLEEGLGYSRDSRRGMTMEDEYAVSYHKSMLSGCPAVYFVWSGMEHVFTDLSCLRQGGSLGASKGSSAASESLWLNPSRKPVKVDLRKRFGWYPYFLWKVDGEFVNLHIPKMVEVFWVPLAGMILETDAWNDEEAEVRNRWIDTVSRMMKSGRDIPPVFLDHGNLVDGNHRGLAAAALGIERVPAVEIGSYWKP